MAKKSAGILMFRKKGDWLELLLVHPGGPFWAKKDNGAWSIPKGEFEDNEDPLEAAKREAKEELSIIVEGNFFMLEPVRQKSGKQVLAWAIEFDLDENKISSNLFEMEWPPKSGKKKQFPEVDRAAWFTVEQALEKINPSQRPLVLQVSERFNA